MKNYILGAISFLALVFAIGSVGAYEYGNIDLNQMLVQIGIGLLVLIVSALNVKD